MSDNNQVFISMQVVTGKRYFTAYILSSSNSTSVNDSINY